MDDVAAGPAFEGIEVDEGLVRDHARQGEAQIRMPVVVIVAAVEVGIIFDCEDLFEENETVQDGGFDAACDGNDGTDPFRVVGGECERGEAPDRGTDHRLEAIDPEVIEEEGCDLGLVRDRDVRKGRAVGFAGGRAGGGGTGGAVASAEKVETEDEVAVGVDGLAGPDTAVPPPVLDVLIPVGAGGRVVRVEAGDVLASREGVKDEDRVRFSGIQFAPGLIRELDWGELSAFPQRERSAVGSHRLEESGPALFRFIWHVVGIRGTGMKENGLF